MQARKGRPRPSGSQITQPQSKLCLNLCTAAPAERRQRQPDDRTGALLGYQEGGDIHPATWSRQLHGRSMVPKCFVVPVSCIE